MRRLRSSCGHIRTQPRLLAPLEAFDPRLFLYLISFFPVEALVPLSQTTRGFHTFLVTQTSLWLKLARLNRIERLGPQYFTEKPKSPGSPRSSDSSDSSDSEPLDQVEAERGGVDTPELMDRLKWELDGGWAEEKENPYQAVRLRVSKQCYECGQVGGTVYWELKRRLCHPCFKRTTITQAELARSFELTSAVRELPQVDSYFYDSESEDKEIKRAAERTAPSAPETANPLSLHYSRFHLNRLCSQAARNLAPSLQTALFLASYTSSPHSLLDLEALSLCNLKIDPLRYLGFKLHLTFQSLGLYTLVKVSPTLAPYYFALQLQKCRRLLGNPGQILQPSSLAQFFAKKIFRCTSGGCAQLPLSLNWLSLLTHHLLSHPTLPTLNFTLKSS